MKPSGTRAVLCFMPVLHKGYLDFLRSNGGDIWIFGNDLIQQYVHLTRDIRAVEPEEMVASLKSLIPERSISVAHSADLHTWKYASTIMPDDEVCHDVAQKYLKDKKVEFAQTFLRWNQVITFQELVISPDRTITSEEFHKKIIDQAFKEAHKSADWWRQIGAIAVKDGKVALSAHNHHLPTDFHLVSNGDPRSNFDAGQHQDIFTSIHAEAEVIASAAKQGISLKGASLYSTTFPCPNCARLIGTAGFKTVYYAKGYSLLDAEKILHHFGVEVVLVQ